MRREDAIKKLSKLLGKNLGYRVDPKAPDQDERDEAREQLKPLVSERDVLRELVRQRCNALLAADAEYQRLKADLAATSKACDEVSSKLHHYRFTVGVSTSLIFRVMAQGDSWEEVIAKLQKERVP